MFAAILDSMNFTPWALFSLILFFSVFIGVLIWVFRKGSSEFYRSLARIPLEIDPENQAPL
ncbi:MAG: cbb3-type cytochrome c oxidase subunit 3 [Deltaproteobacteria bacterium]|jgi:cbb3-type cytochrome oxidase subunit 3|nr:cbb3-type cytochrome c oxidase subunit 3 [Deltaproteobacteria bacterium]MBT4267304.1 cbb3-type cytochrome c oxidase subunit 3 [Deltaproteobacteria bacterium]MBT4638197.1 cbb3-type cytochrome c oxidase subunit 3 [Deltaproteobacteria bacterium]MBT6501391.1 cbb3-type cytochrome c oxidase subunit 3 [Deltaproteobacteria bacterium]MBT6614381.1 cbb3-type cytochrome c oxidase subunit 3 [Deltaproteobacteria bacterium]